MTDDPVRTVMKTTVMIMAVIEKDVYEYWDATEAARHSIAFQKYEEERHGVNSWNWTLFLNFKNNNIGDNEYSRKSVAVPTGSLVQLMSCQLALTPAVTLKWQVFVVWLKD